MFESIYNNLIGQVEESQASLPRTISGENQPIIDQKRIGEGRGERMKRGYIKKSEVRQTQVIFPSVSSFSGKILLSERIVNYWEQRRGGR